MSVGVPVVPIGTIGARSPAHRLGRRPALARSASSSGLSGSGAVGVKLLTRMPYGARSMAAARTKLLTPPLWKAYAMMPAVPDQPLDEEMHTIEPLMPRSAIAVAACLVLRKQPSADTRTARST